MRFMKTTSFTSGESTGTGETEQDKKALAYAKKGLVLALLSGLIFSADGLLVKGADAHHPYGDQRYFLLIPLICAGIHDFCAACLTTFLNWRNGRLPEIWRSAASKPGRYVLGGAVIGALCGMGGYMVSLQLAGPAYVLPITSMYPAVAAALAVFMLKERITKRTWAGLLLCVTGAVIIGYTPPDGQIGHLFYIGLAFAALAAVGWGLEGVCATSGMDFIEPVVALNIYYFVSTGIYVFLLVPMCSVVFFPVGECLDILGTFIASKGSLFVALAGFLGAVSYRAWYCSMNMTGVSRAMALNVSYALWGILLSAVFTDVELTRALVIGAFIIFFGMLLVIGNPRDMLNLREVR
jgi:drug/metabolite transporter (DMT)-like permease